MESTMFVTLIEFASKISITLVQTIGSRFGTSKLSRKLRILFERCSVGVSPHVYDGLVNELFAILNVLFVMRILKILCMHYLHAHILLKCGTTPIYGTLQSML